MNEPFVEMLRGNSNSLGRTDEVAAAVLADPTRATEVYELFFQDDEWVRLRAASVSKRIWRADSELFAPFIEGWIDHVATIDQPSAQWTFAQMCGECDHLMTEDQRERSISIVSEYLATNADWIVLNSSIATITEWARTRPDLAKHIHQDLLRLSEDPRKSVAKRATKSLDRLAELFDMP